MEQKFFDVVIYKKFIDAYIVYKYCSENNEKMPLFIGLYCLNYIPTVKRLKVMFIGVEMTLGQLTRIFNEASLAVVLDKTQQLYFHFFTDEKSQPRFLKYLLSSQSPRNNQCKRFCDAFNPPNVFSIWKTYEDDAVVENCIKQSKL